MPHGRKAGTTFPESCLPPVQMAPPTLTVTKGEGGYILRWEAEKMSFSHIVRTFQVQYKRAAVSWQVRACALQGPVVVGGWGRGHV